MRLDANPRFQSDASDTGAAAVFYGSGDRAVDSMVQDERVVGFGHRTRSNSRYLGLGDDGAHPTVGNAPVAKRSDVGYQRSVSFFSTSDVPCCCYILLRVRLDAVCLAEGNVVAVAYRSRNRQGTNRREIP